MPAKAATKSTAPGRAIVPPRKGERRPPNAGSSAARAPATTSAPLTVSKPAAGPVIFIDVDGVLNACNQPDDSDLYFPSGREAEMRDSYLVLSATRLSRFAELVKAHDCRIVLSTSWRLMALARTVLLAAFAEHGIEARVLGDTPDLSQTSEGSYPAGVRVDEIGAWLAQNGDPPWIAIDDGPMGTTLAQEHLEEPLMDGHFVNTECDEGLTEEMSKAAGALLANPSSRTWRPAAPEIAAARRAQSDGS